MDTISPIAPPLVPKLWPAIEAYIEKALRKGDALKYSLPCDILGHIIFNHMFLWIAHDEAQTRVDAAIVLKFLEWDRSKSLYVPIIGGKNMKLWQEPLMKALDAFAKRHGCIDIQGQTRKGWARSGFDITGVTLTRKVC